MENYTLAMETMGINSGPTDIATVDILTGQTSVALTAPTEEINTFRKFNGKLYAPWVDPTGWGGAVNGAYSSGNGSGWQNHFTFPAGHVYDYTELGTSRFLAGGIAYGGAGIWQSDNNGPWRLVLEENSSGGSSGWERFYWIATINGKVYAQAKHDGGATSALTSTMFPMRVLDRGQWKTVKDASIGASQASQVEVFNGKAYYFKTVFDGRRTLNNNIPFYPVDFYNDGTYLYAISDSGLFARTTGSGKWQSLSKLVHPSGGYFSSFAVVGGNVFTGDTAGIVHKTPLTA
jgi:hypothetical protein